MVLLILAATCFAQIGEPVTADTVKSDTVDFWSDTTLVFSDSLTVSHATLQQDWFYPVGAILVTCVGFLMLFTVRSR